MTSQHTQQQQSQQHQHHALQEINQEDLTAILPPQEQEDAPFDGFEDSESGRLVSKAIERMSLGADSDTSENGDQNPVPVYSSALLQQFVEKTALLSEPRKRRSKLGKKLNDNEYPCVSNVSPDSGIQSVDNSPLHLAISPVSPLAQTQSPIQPPVVTKPAVNVDRVLYPPKRKPGRPAKTVSAMQPRGPGRPRLKPEIVEKTEKKEATLAKSAKQEVVSAVKKRGKAKSLPCKPAQASREQKEESAPAASKRTMKAKPTYQKKRYGPPAKLSQEKTGIVKKAGTITSVPMRVKCLSRSTASKLLPQCDGRTCRKVRQDRTSVPNNKTTTPLTRQRQMSCEQVANDQKAPVSGANKRSSKENRNNAAALSRKQNLAKKAAAPPVNTRRVLKENKCNKKATGASGLETNGVGVQTLISLPVGDILKAENAERVSNKCDKATQPAHNNHCHKHHHHKHRRRLLAPPKNPIRINPCIIQEMEKLIEEFARSCSLGRNNAGANHSELPQIFRVKKLTKKRKGDVSAGDDQKLKRRLKKEKVLAGADSKSSANTSTNSNPNEQRLPLKKRHYHVSSPHSSQSSNASCADTNVNESNSTENHIEEAIEATITRYGGSSASSVHEEATPVTPKKRLRDADNAVPDKQSSDVSEDKPAAQSEVQPRRKKKIVKDLRVTVTKLPTESHGGILEKGDKADKSVEKSSKISTEKSTKSEKTTTLAERSTKADKAQLDDKFNVEHVRAEKSIKVNSELHVSETLDDTETASESKVITRVGNASMPNLMNNTAAMILTKKKMRRRKTINRTGFPTLKKKKKKKEVVNDSSASNNPLINIVKALGNDPRIETPLTITEDNKASLLGNDTQNALLESNEDKRHARGDVKNFDNSSTAQETSSRSGSDEVTETCTGQLRVRKDLVESDSSVLSDKLYPVKYEKLQDCRTYDENVSLEESLERYNQSQRIAELSEENLRKLERANAQAAGVKMELSSCFNNNHKRRRGSASPSNLGPRSAKRLRSGGYDTESEAPPSSDVASEDQEVRKPVGATHNRKKQSRWKKRYFHTNCVFSEYNKKIIACDCMQHCATLPPNVYHCGKLLRQRKMPGQLHYEWLNAQPRQLQSLAQPLLQQQPQQKSQKKVPSWNYK